jgi:tRNA threonylcarbamoyladenosine biosynthesis protein TsaE
MRALGRAVAADLHPGELVVVSGPLGAGKTTLVQGIALGLGVSEPVLSPTFVLARVHRSGRIPLVHADAYRLGTVADPLAEIDALDLDASLDDSVVVVEWGEGLTEQLTDDRLHISIELTGPGDIRTVRWPG